MGRNRSIAGVIDNGAVLGDGDTVGLSEREKIRVSHAAIAGTGIATFRLSLERTDAA